MTGICYQQENATFSHLRFPRLLLLGPKESVHKSLIKSRLILLPWRLHLIHSRILYLRSSIWFIIATRVHHRSICILDEHRRQLRILRRNHGTPHLLFMLSQLQRQQRRRPMCVPRRHNQLISLHVAGWQGLSNYLLLVAVEVVDRVNRSRTALL